jgi:hypothetical protein
MFQYQEGDRCAVIFEGKAMKARVVGQPMPDLVAVTFTKNGEPTVFSVVETFPLYRYPNLAEQDYSSVVPLCMIQNEQLYESGPKE